ncbi:MAG: NUDIX hydrolase [Candidatus Pacearchaeota archaeon]|nr:NUDIX hydrolase [Candidatus Pacearchaeota archaeon]
MKNSIINIASKFIKHEYVYAGVPVIIQNSKKEILLGKRNNRVLSYPGVWGLPGGMIDYGEKLIDVARRELKEELGVDVKIIGRAKNVYET